MAERTVDGERLSRKEYLELVELPVELLTENVDIVRSELAGESVTVRGLGYVTRGIYSQGCGFCAYSARYDTDVEQHGVIEREKLREVAKRAERKGAERFNLVSTRRGADSDLRINEWQEVLGAIETPGRRRTWT